MVRGLEVFRDWFVDHSDAYVLIGGTAASLTMEEAGQEFRTTKDLDVVLHVEVLTSAFAQRFWEFIAAGEYEIRQRSESSAPTLYRFQKPAKEQFPYMVELFARRPDLPNPIVPGHLTPIPFDEPVSSLSAILLDDDYYRFVLEGRRKVNGITCIGEDRLIPLKAVAWLELHTRRSQGEDIAEKSVRKHAHDVLRLSSLLASTTRIPIVGRIAADMKEFLKTAVFADGLDPRSLGLGDATVPEMLARVAVAYGLSEERPSQSRTS